VRVSFRELERAKVLARSRLESSLSHESVLRARSDFHARRSPRPCGLTVHPGLGCSAQCAYCYVEDMGFDFGAIRPYALTGSELAYALLSNPHFFPTLSGTYLAFGSVTEPLHPVVLDRTMSYLSSVSGWLGNPCQLSTKFPVSERVAARIASLRGSPINPLVTIVTLERSRLLEPRAPDPALRLESIRVMRRAGLKPMLFLRPIIPGVNDDELDDIVSAAKEAGAYGVVVGGLRVTRRILERLERLGLDTREIRRRLTSKPVGAAQVPVATEDLKREAIEEAKRRGLVPFRSACCANTYNVLLQRGVRVPCAGLCFLTDLCTSCPVNCRGMEVEVDEEDLRYAVKRLSGEAPEEVGVAGPVVYVRLKAASRSRARRVARELRALEPLIRKRVAVLARGGPCLSSG